MNYCTKCSSYYQKAGTCNCYAEGGEPTFVPIPQPNPIITSDQFSWLKPPYTITSGSATYAGPPVTVWY